MRATLTSTAVFVPVLFLLSSSGAPAAAADGPSGPSSSSCIQGGACTVDGLKTPTSPAFVLIGASPTQVERPTTPQDVALTLYNAVQFAGGLPKNFVLEVAPFLAIPASDTSYDRLHQRRRRLAVVYNATLSLATATTDAVNTTLGYTDIGLGTAYPVLHRPLQRINKRLPWPPLKRPSRNWN